MEDTSKLLVGECGRARIAGDRGQADHSEGRKGELPFFCSCSWPVPLRASAIHSRWVPGTPANDQELRTM